MPLVQMVKTYASAEHMLETGKVYTVSEPLAVSLLKDNACVPYRESQLPKGKKAKQALMPDPRPDPQFGNGADGKGKKPIPTDDSDDDDDEDDDEDSK